MRRFLITILMAIIISASSIFAVCPSADLTGDCRVNMEDFADLAEQWLAAYGMDDLASMASEWLTEGILDDPENMVWVTINDSGVPTHEPFNGQMSKYETTNAQY